MDNFNRLSRRKPFKSWLQLPDPWAEAHPEFYRRQSAPIYSESPDRLLWCSNEYATAGAVWQKKEGQWKCIATTPILKWMRGMNPVDAKMELLKRGYKFKWL